MSISKKQKAWNTAKKALEAAERMADDKKIHWPVRSRIEEISWADSYAEPGYKTEVGIVFGNWNTVDEYDKVMKDRIDLPMGDLPKRLAEIFEKLGFEVEWSDEWSVCSDCGKAFRTSGDWYFWKPSYAIINDYELLCKECIEESPETYLVELTNDPKRCMTFDIDLSKHGFELFNDKPYESGWLPWQTDNPQETLKELNAKGFDVIFVLDENSQFYSTWSAWVKKLESDDEEDLEDESENESEI